MTDLRKAAEMALTVLDYHFDNHDDYLNWKYPLVLEAKQALRQALAQPEQKREWVGLTDDDFNVKKVGDFNVIKFAKHIEQVLKGKNGYK